MYAITSQLQREDDPAYRCAVFLIGGDALDISDTFKYDSSADSTLGKSWINLKNILWGRRKRHMITFIVKNQLKI